MGNPHADGLRFVVSVAGTEADDAPRHGLENRDRLLRHRFLGFSA